MFDKLGLKPGDRLLDVGCGWGGMVRHAARHGVQGARRHAVAPSRRPGRRRRSPTRAWPTSPRCGTATTATSRETRFDAVSSIGLTEHIGVANYPAYFGFLQDQAARRRPAAQPLHHPARQHPAPADAGGFIDRYVFPDGELTGSGRIITEAQDAGLEVRHEENLREHYALTLPRLVRATSSSTGTSASPRSARAPRGCGACTWPDRGWASSATSIQLHQVLAVKLDERGGGAAAAAAVVAAVGGRAGVSLSASMITA